MKKNKTIRLLLLTAVCFLTIGTHATTGDNTINVTETVQQKKKLTGTITDEFGPVIGATVIIKGKPQIGTVSDADGKYALDISEGETIVVSFVGYAKKEILYKGETTLDIKLEDEAYAFDEYVVVGYGVKKKTNVTGSVSSVSAKDIENRPVSSVTAALAGQMPGVTSIQRSGGPGSQTGSITIRGKNSINATDPLVVIDGVPSSMSSLNGLDPMDIENLSVLKDAASSAIYGVQAANGVILVTTKRGTSSNGLDKPRINYSGSVSLGSPVAKLKYLGSADYATLYNEAVLNANPNAKPQFSDEEIQMYRDGRLPNTDWYKEVIKSTATETRHNLSITGGSDKTNYNAAVGYARENSIARQEDYYERFTARLGVDTKVTKWMTAGLNASGYRGDRNSEWTGTTSLIAQSNRIAPIYPVYNEDGSFHYAGMDNPAALLGRSGMRKTTTQEENLQAYLSIDPIEGLNIKGLYAVRHLSSKINNFKNRLIYGDDASKADTGDREGEARNNDTNIYTGQLLANYNKTLFNDHSISVLLGYEQNETKYKYLKATRRGGGSDYLPETITSLDESSSKVENQGYENASRSYFARLGYDYKNKYLFEANIRRDGSSRFHKDYRWGTFPAFSVGWRVTEEEFMKGVDWLSNLKLRAGYGKTGNVELSDNYPTMFTYSYSNYYLGNAIYSTTLDARAAEANLSWANVKSYEIGLEAGFLNNKIGFEIELYNKDTDGMLITPSVPGAFGMSAPWLNMGKVNNKGFDLNIFHHNVINQDWKYSAVINLGYVKNEIKDLWGPNFETKDTDGRQWYIKGQPIGTFYGLVADGFFNTDDDLKNHPLRRGDEKLGDIKYIDQNNDGKIDDKDRVPIGKEIPDVVAGLNLSVDYKNFGLSMLFQGAFGADAYITGEAAYAFYNGGKVLEKHLDRWTPDNHNASHPRLLLNPAINVERTNSFWLQSTDYVRLKNVTFSYTLPKLLVNKAYLQNAMVYLTGENLFTISDLDGIDPEAPVNGNRGGYYSNMRKFTLGVKLTF